MLTSWTIDILGAWKNCPSITQSINKYISIISINKIRKLENHYKLQIPFPFTVKANFKREEKASYRLLFSVEELRYKLRFRFLRKEQQAEYFSVFYKIKKGRYNEYKLKNKKSNILTCSLDK